jgi:hypothetical protein
VSRIRRSLAAAVAAVVSLTFGVASPAAAAADVQALAGSPDATSYANGWYDSADADDVAFDLLVKHHRTVLRCAPSAFALLLPGVGPVRWLSAARAARVQGYARAGRATQARKLVSVLRAVEGVAGKGCAAAFSVAYAAYEIHQAGQRSDQFYYADNSTFRDRTGFNSCTIDIAVSEDVAEEEPTAAYPVEYRWCGPTW